MGTYQKWNVIYLYQNGYTDEEIAEIINLQLTEVNMIFYENKKIRRKNLIPDKVIKIREEYNIMLENGYSPHYIRAELSRLHRVKPWVISGIIKGVTYKKVQKGRQKTNKNP